MYIYVVFSVPRIKRVKYKALVSLMFYFAKYKTLQISKNQCKYSDI